MSKAITYSVVARPQQPGMPESEVNYHAQAQARAETTLEEMATQIEERCTVTYPDAVAVLTALEDRVIEALRNGEIVQLGKLGNLQVSMGSTPCDKKEDFNESMLRRPRIVFRPGKALRDTAKKARFERVPKLKDPSADDEGEAAMLQSEPQTADSGQTEQQG